ncbi:MAG: GntR family transcriptional regulator [Sphingomonadaceae bacterium]|nr:GntR family transcriptional regulator [Sphingomonadaceae bacterium]
MTATALSDMLEEGPLPLYYQLENRLRERIAKREFGPGAFLPSEDMIGTQYGVSRITVRRALGALQQEGLIERRRGVGSFVSERQGGMNSHLTGSLAEFLTAATALTTEIIVVSEEVPPPDVVKSLRLATGRNALLLKTVGSLEGQGPVTFINIWVPLEVGKSLTYPAEPGIPVIRQVERALHARLTRAEQLIEADRAGEEAARYLGIDPDTPILRGKRVYYAHPDTPIEVAYVSYHPERYRYAIDFKG